MRKVDRLAPAWSAPTRLPADAQLAEAKLILVGAIIRWSQQGTGGNVRQTAGPLMLGISPNPTGYRLWPSEMTQLQ